MARGRAATILSIVILAAVSLRVAAEFKVQAEAAALNETARHDDEVVEENELPLYGEPENRTDRSPTEHPHKMHGKPSKFDVDLRADDKADYQIESTRMDNITTASPLETNSATTMTTTTTTRATTRATMMASRYPAYLTRCRGSQMFSCLRRDFLNFLDRISRVDTYNVTEHVQIVKNPQANVTCDNRREDGEETNLLDKVHRYARTHVMKIQLGKDLSLAGKARTFFGSFGLKKLLLPLFFGVQIIKSVLLALFLPSIIGSIGNIVGKGVSSFAQSSHPPVPEENFEFKDNSDLYNDDYLTRQPVGTLPASAMYDESMMQTQKSPEIASRYAFVDSRISHANALSDRYYTRHVAAHGLSKKQDFKVFHEIPTSSLLLTNYDPFYSPLLSRLDAVFSRLGHNTEGCREYAVCAMYRSPARYAPYSNLVSAQLSRELNELRKPSSDNPDVLRFFRYMKAAKDGQDGVKCEELYANCANAREDQSLKQNQAMLATYQDINKLVQARKI
ncbi:uncharacterized protein LOC116840443 isoform X2 [Odontomachus brunneus]|uniref:uncharacterized protein LOC116840443 isoform X2 n=1 Tax=Odontomachus brunneus TaxID=486640 RepID=UPI0013F25790|nr:uncharacterized protein LOC116840443 isoform X2 [Odontomachus brunneus]